MGPLDLADPLFYSVSLWIYCGPVDSCGSTSYYVASCGPTVYMCFFADLLRIYCGPVDSCGSTISLTADSLQIYCGSTAGPLHLAGPLFICVSLQIYCGSTAGLLILADPLLR